MPQPPPETSTSRAWAGTPSAARASPRVRGIRNSGEIGGAHPLDAAGADQPLDLRYRLGVGDEMEVDPGCAQ